MEYINFIVIIVLLIIGYVFGTYAEKKSFKSIIEREKKFSTIPAMSTRIPPDEYCDQVLVSGNIVVANDYFKQIVAGLKGIFGGQLNTYESLLERGRREAILRMKEEAKKINATMIFNVKLNTTNLASSEGKKSGTLEVYAYGTALVEKPSEP